MVGNPLGGVLRELNRKSRTAGRRTRPPREVDPEPGAGAPPAPCGPVGAVLVTGEDGRAAWTLPASYEAAPVVTAAALDPCPADDESTVWAVLEEVTTWSVRVRVWRSRPRRGTGVAEPVGAGVRVHVAVVPVA
ncbi:hypothetical protein [Streptomyces sp. AD55]|uniref:hypothetical protein n=1 Tax=Streptomyces sp. AD55 TaxID=3242895 RepID=UPI0035283C25